MQYTVRRRFSGEHAPIERRGVALVYAVFGAFIAASMVTVMFTMAGVSNKNSIVKRATIQARYLAEGGVEMGMRDVRQSVANWNEPPAGGVVAVGATNVDYTIREVGEEQVQIDPSGIQTIVRPFEVEARVAIDGYRARAHRIVQAASTPLFQFAVFYTNDLEVFPGPNMRLGGRVHTNGNMYLGSGATLTLDTNYVRAVGSIFRRRKQNTESAGNVEIRKWVANPFDPTQPVEYFRMNSQPQMGSIANSSGYDSAFTEGYDHNGDGDFWDTGDWLPFGPGALDYWGPPEGYSGNGHTVMTGEHGVTQAMTPGSGSIAMYEAMEGGSYSLDTATGEYEYVGPGLGSHDRGYYHENAGLSIIVAADGASFTVFDASGNDVTSAVGGAVTLVSVPDMRQSSSQPTRVRAVQVDVALLNASGNFPANGLLYAAHYGTGTGIQAKGLVLTNGSELGAPLTAVAEGAIYVKGDYNTVNKKGASVIGDAVNLLSNAWTGNKAPGQLPAATQTTYNCAMVTGNYATNTSNYNGGLENLPRFHENWNGVPCNIRGSFVNMYESQYATGNWVYGGDRYTAPVRNWSYDAAFNNVANLPPFTPMAVSVVDVVSW